MAGPLDSPHMTANPEKTLQNPFETALLEAAPATYAALARAGLGETFNPLPLSARGFGLAANLLDPNNRAAHDASQEDLAALLSEMGLDFLSEQEIPQRSPIASCAHQLGLAHAPFASLAMWHPQRAPFWRMLSPQQLLLISPTALPIACMANNAEAISALLAAGADPNMVDSGGKRIIFRCPRPSTLSILLEAGADLRNTTTITDKHNKAVETSMLSMLVEQDATGYSRDTIKDFKSLALRWAEKNPAVNALRGADVAAAAFKAIAARNRATVKECLKSLGADALLHVNRAGDSLAIACAKADLYIELGLLVDSGADLSEVDLRGNSALGALIARRPFRNNIHSKTTAADAARANKLSGGDLAAGFDWAKASPSGALLIEPMIYAATPQDLLAHIEQALLQGLDMRKPLSFGMDMACSLLLRGCLMRHAQGFSEKGKAANEHACNAISSFLNRFPPEESSLQSKEAFVANLFELAARNPITNADWPNVADGSFAEMSRSHEISRDSLLLLGSKIAHEGCESLGRRGAAFPARDSTPFVDARQRSLFHSSYERGAIEAQISSGALPPRRARARL